MKLIFLGKVFSDTKYKYSEILLKDMEDKD